MATKLVACPLFNAREVIHHVGIGIDTVAIVPDPKLSNFLNRLQQCGQCPRLRASTLSARLAGPI